jgi:hypothetical protein
MSNFADPTNRQVVWDKQYRRLLRNFLNSHRYFDGSEVAKYMRAKGLPDPEHHNIWGARINYYASKGWFSKTMNRGVPSGACHKQTCRIWESKLYD